MSEPVAGRTPDVALEVRALEVGYARRAILPPIDLTVRAGELWALIGRNGGGKTTLVRTLLGLLPPIGGVAAAAPGHALAYVPQRDEDEDAVPGRVVDVVAAGADRGWAVFDPSAGWRARHRVRAAIADVGAQALARRPFAALSGGQRQRVRIARALASAPTVLVLDEPTSALDLVVEHRIFDLLDDLRRERSVAVVVATHHLAFVAERATHALLVDHDRDLALSGPAGEVLDSAAFAGAYGLRPANMDGGPAR